jgi:hypothetical protein
MFRLLALHPVPDISVAATASLTATEQPETRRLLGELTRFHLIAEHVPGRYASTTCCAPTPPARPGLVTASSSATRPSAGSSIITCTAPGTASSR